MKVEWNKWNIVFVSVENNVLRCYYEVITIECETTKKERNKNKITSQQPGKHHKRPHRGQLTIKCEMLSEKKSLPFFMLRCLGVSARARACVIHRVCLLGEPKIHFSYWNNHTSSRARARAHAHAHDAVVDFIE